MDPILNIIDEALARKGLSDAAASKMAVGNYALIKNMRSSRSDEKRYSYQALERLADVLELECYFGPRRETGPVEHTVINGTDYAAIPRLDARLSAGTGSLNGDAEVIETLAFRRDWLEKMNIAPSKAVLVNVTGNSMQPGLHDGDLALVDTTRRVVLSGQIYALTDSDGSTRVKRVDLLPGQGFILRSDNPEHSAEPRLGGDANRVTIHGQVVWSGHIWK